MVKIPCDHCYIVSAWEVSFHTSFLLHSWTDCLVYRKCLDETLLLLYSINESIHVSRSLRCLSLYKKHPSDAAVRWGDIFSDGLCILDFNHDLNVLHVSEPTIQFGFPEDVQGCSHFCPYMSFLNSSEPRRNTGEATCCHVPGYRKDLSFEISEYQSAT